MISKEQAGNALYNRLWSHPWLKASKLENKKLRVPLGTTLGHTTDVNRCGTQ